jgi:predicted hotdog family 3-hydroxylacyl-ACP dehydratase
MRLERADWAHLIPHAGAMCLLDAVLEWDAQCIHASSAGHRNPQHPLRSEGHLHAVHLAEYGAQATAVHGALCARRSGKLAPRPGMLVALRDVRLAVEFIDAFAGDLHVHADCLHADLSGSLYTFRVEHAGLELASGRVTIMHSAA